MPWIKIGIFLAGLFIGGCGGFLLAAMIGAAKMGDLEMHYQLLMKDHKN